MLRSLLLYTALVFGANGAFAGAIDFEAAQQGGLAKLIETEPTDLPDTVFLDADGNEVSFADYAGTALLVNFWATWCAPCREEMPSLDALQTELGGDDFQVLTIATGRNPREAIDRFYEEEAIENLPILTDARQKLSRDMGVMGLPVTVLISPEGKEVARLLGDADWASDAAKQVIRELKAP
ncbi:TlpA family protein disulfide reductase [Paracoccus sp. M683]|uniref:TlpA disulfide reductase family protein n=1 Tax=Paracoccus sp. M683 TaxID=2594268 RepID=UPI00117CEEAE|nr:TlpA disulfide reductase family protein [Paracoccus sp. M683]TRW99266.1 TlpA family protein disulfide reductase [Paracoccus sp. M683]